MPSGTVLNEVKHPSGCLVSQQWPNFASKSIVKDFSRNMDAEMISKAYKSASARFVKVRKIKDDYFHWIHDFRKILKKVDIIITYSVSY